jgi:hypothetical protein
MIVDRVGDEYSASLSQRLQPRRHVNPIAEDVMLLGNHVAEVDTHPELNALLWRGARVALRHASLDLNGAAHGVHHARELRQQTIAGVLYDPAAVLGDLGVDQLPEVRGEALVSALFVSTHKAGVPRNVGG